MEHALRRPDEAAAVIRFVLHHISPLGPFRPGEVFDVEAMLKHILERLPTLTDTQCYVLVRSQDYERISQLLGPDPLSGDERAKRAAAFAIILYLQKRTNERPRVAGELSRGKRYLFGGHALRDRTLLPVGKMSASQIRLFGELVELWFDRVTRLVLVYYRDENGRIQRYQKPLLDEPDNDPHLEVARYLFREYLPAE